MGEDREIEGARAPLNFFGGWRIGVQVTRPVSDFSELTKREGRKKERHVPLLTFKRDTGTCMFVPPIFKKFMCNTIMFWNGIEE